jgi:hypothetical protein
LLARVRIPRLASSFLPARVCRLRRFVMTRFLLSRALRVLPALRGLLAPQATRVSPDLQAPLGLRGNRVWLVIPAPMAWMVRTAPTVSTDRTVSTARRVLPVLSVLPVLLVRRVHLARRAWELTVFSLKSVPVSA